MTSSPRRAFTLIELLVVVAIIGILAAILFPVFARAREQARKASCSSNLKQIGLALLQYRQDYDEKFPRNHNVDLGQLGWAERIQPYTKSLQIFQCPTDAQPQVLPKRYTDYYMNNYLFNVAEGISEAEVSFPANTISNGDGRSGNSDMLCRGVNNFAGTPCDTGDGNGENNIQPPDFAASVRRHSEGANYVFVDGHVKWLRPDSILLYSIATTPVVTSSTIGFRFR